MKLVVLLLFGTILLAATSGLALAHSELIQSKPAPGEQLADSPPEIRLTFSEPVAANSQIVLLTDSFESIEGLVPQFNPEHPEVVYTPLPPLEAGIYTVQWAAASADGHEIRGSYTFSVGLGTPTAPDLPPAETVTPAAGRIGLGVEWWIVALAAVAVGMSLLLLFARRARRD